jgi:hypothetical protein
LHDSCIFSDIVLSLNAQSSRMLNELRFYIEKSSLIFLSLEETISIGERS